MPNFPSRGPKDWSPLRIEKILKGLDALTFDTDPRSGRVPSATAPGYQPLRSVVTILPDGKLSGYHVTDDPEAVIRAIERGDLKQEGSEEDERVGGILVNDFSEETRQTSPKSWGPLKTLGLEDREYLERLVMLELYSKRGRGLLTEIEYERVGRAVAAWRETGDIQTLMETGWLGDYGVAMVSIAEKNMPINPWRPYEVPVVFEGRYLDYTKEAALQSRALAAHHLKKPEGDVMDADVGITWRDLGWDGAILTAHADQVGSVLIWNPKKILSYGSREESRLMGGSS